MIRRAFIMRLKPDAMAQYQQRHENIWPELVAEIQRSGIASITTFQHEAELFIVSEVTDLEAWERLWNSDVHKRWKQLMEPLVQLGDHGAVAASELVEISHIATNGAVEAIGTTESPDASDEPAAILSIADAPALVRRDRPPGSRAKAPVAPPSETLHKMGAPRAGKSAIKRSAGKKKAKRKPGKQRVDRKGGKKAHKKKAGKKTKTRRAKSRKRKISPRVRTARKKTATKRR